MNGQRVAPWKFDVLKASRFALEALLLGQKDVTKIWNGERGMGVWERVDSGNPPENSEWRCHSVLCSPVLSVPPNTGH